MRKSNDISRLIKAQTEEAHNISLRRTFYTSTERLAKLIDSQFKRLHRCLTLKWCPPVLHLKVNKITGVLRYTVTVNNTIRNVKSDFKSRAVEKGGKGVSYPGPRSVGGAPRSLRMIFLSPFTGIQKLIIQNLLLLATFKLILLYSVISVLVSCCNT